LLMPVVYLLHCWRRWNRWNHLHTSPSEYTVNEPSSIGNTGRPELSRGTGVMRRRGCVDVRDFLEVRAIIDDVTSSATSKKQSFT